MCSKFCGKLESRAFTVGIRKIMRLQGWDLGQLFHTKLLTMTSSFNNTVKRLCARILECTAVSPQSGLHFLKSYLNKALL